MRNAILLDFDDTLVETTVHFDVAKGRFAGVMSGLGIPAEEALETLNRFDIKNVRLCGGFLKECFPRALGETYAHYCRVMDLDYSQSLKKELEELGWWVFEQPARPIEGAQAVLESLYGRFPLFLVTKGDPAVQAVRVEESGLSRWFDKIYVLADKNISVYKSIAVEQRLRPPDSWVVGNSMKSDINPAIKAGFNCIHVYHPHTWDYEDEEPVGGHISVNRITDVLKVVGVG